MATQYGVKVEPLYPPLSRRLVGCYDQFSKHEGYSLVTVVENLHQTTRQDLQATRYSFEKVPIKQRYPFWSTLAGAVGVILIPFLLFVPGLPKSLGWGVVVALWVTAIVSVIFHHLIVVVRMRALHFSKLLESLETQLRDRLFLHSSLEQLTANRRQAEAPFAALPASKHEEELVSRLLKFEREQ